MMILNLQLFAKSSSGARGGRSSRGSAGGGHRQDIHGDNSSKKEETKEERRNIKTKGEAVAAVSKEATYEVYVVSHNKEMLVADRSGSDILKKLIYRKDRGAWISPRTGYRYIVRKKR